MNESLRVRQVGSVENGLALFEEAGRLAVVDHGGGQQAEAGMTLIGEKFFTFVTASEQDPDFAAELPGFLTAIRRVFAADEIREYLDHLEQTKFSVPPEPEIEMEDGEEEVEEEPWPANPVRGAEELLRFSRVQDLYAAHKDNQTFLHARFGLGEDVLEPYKKTIDRWLWPDVFRNQDTSVS